MSTADEIRQDEEVNAAHLFLGFLGSLVPNLENLEKDPTAAANGLETQDLVDAVAVLQDIRSRVGNIERDLITVAGRREGRMVGSLSDGRQFTLERASDRKEWDHDDWKRDARRAVVAKTMADLQLPKVLHVVDIEGEVSALAVAPILHEAIATAQEVHGSTAPRSRALFALGLKAGDYATSSPAGWRFSAIKPEPTTPSTTDTEEKKADA